MPACSADAGTGYVPPRLPSIIGLATGDRYHVAASSTLPIVGYLAVHRRDILAEMLDSASMLDTLLRRQTAKRDLLEFLRILLGVETIIATDFWLVSTHFASWRAGLALFGFGVLLTGLAWRQKKRAEGSIQNLQGLRATLLE